MTRRKILAAVLFFSMILCTANADAAISDKDFFNLCSYGSAKDVGEALKAGADVNAKDQTGATALMYAAADNNNPETIALLLENGADVNYKDDEGITALMSAASGNNPETVALLLKNGAILNAADDAGMTALMYAASFNNNPETIRCS